MTTTHRRPLGHTLGEAELERDLERELAPRAVDDGRTPEQRRGHPMPPWTGEPRLPTGAELLAWLLELLDPDRVAEPTYKPDGVRQAEAYLNGLLDRTSRAQLGASRCAMTHGRDVDAGLADLGAQLDEARRLLDEYEQRLAGTFSPAHAGGDRGRC